MLNSVFTQPNWTNKYTLVIRNRRHILFNTQSFKALERLRRSSCLTSCLQVESGRNSYQKLIDELNVLTITDILAM